MNIFPQEVDVNVGNVKFPDSYQAKLNLVYGTFDGWDGTFDFYCPKETSKPTPLIIDVHGGGWLHGVKESHTDFDVFFNQNWAVANIEYRVARQATAPAAIEDVRCALIYLIKNAKQFNVDPEKIVIMGNSSGGHLALMAGLLGNNRLFDENCKDDINVKVMAIIDKYGYTDVRRPEKLFTKSLVKWTKEKSSDKEFLKKISPVTYVNGNVPPVIIFHGNEDTTVPYEQSETLNNELEKNGVQHEFVTVDGAEHGNFNKAQKEFVDGKIVSFLTALGINR